MSFILNYDFGVHHVKVNTDKKSFFSVIDDLSNEFTIYKAEFDDRILYQIENYYGDLVIVGEVLND